MASDFSLKKTRMLLKYARKDGISRKDLLRQSNDEENTVSVLYCYNLFEKSREVETSVRSRNNNDLKPRIEVHDISPKKSKLFRKVIKESSQHASHLEEKK